MCLFTHPYSDMLKFSEAKNNFLKIYLASCVSDSHVFPIVACVTPQIFFLSLGITNSTLNLASSEIKNATGIYNHTNEGIVRINHK